MRLKLKVLRNPCLKSEKKKIRYQTAEPQKTLTCPMLIDIVSPSFRLRSRGFASCCFAFVCPVGFKSALTRLREWVKWFSQ